MSFKSFAVIASVVMLVCCAAPALSQPVNYWTATQPYTQSGEAKAVVDAQGNVYVADPANNGTMSATVTKFTAAGQVAWVGFGPLEPKGDCADIKLTPDGGVLAGFHHFVHEGRTDSTIQKFSATGGLQWYKYNTSYLQHFDVDSAGYFYASYDGFLIKRNPNGSTAWSIPSGVYAFGAVLADQHGGVYVNAYNNTPYPGTFFFMHVNAAGVPTTVPGLSTGKMVLAGNFIYAIGGTGPPINNILLETMLVYKMDLNMNVLWSQPLNLPFGSAINQITVDAKGNVIIAGNEEIDSFHFPIVTMKYDTNGNFVYQNLFPGAANSYSYAEGVVANANGDAFVLMTLTMRLVEGNFRDLGVVRYGPQGNLVWPLSGGMFYNGALMYDSGGNDGFGAGIGLDHLGNILIGGYSDVVANNTDNYQVFASKYGPLNSSDFVSQSVPTAMTAGHSYPVTVTFKNTGLATWTAAGGYALESRNPGANTIWGFSKVQLAPTDSIAPNASKTFTFQVTAPSVAGHYNFQWKVTLNGVGGIGALSPNVSVNVTP